MTSATITGTIITACYQMSNPFPMSDSDELSALPRSIKTNLKSDVDLNSGINKTALDVSEAWKEFRMTTHIRNGK